jgi:hypothetical protein
MKKIAFFAVALLSACATTHFTAVPITPAMGIKHVCVRGNPKVIVKDFLNNLQQELARHSVTSEVLPADGKPETCEVTLEYDARQSWASNDNRWSYMSRANVWLVKGSKTIASVAYDGKYQPKENDAEVLAVLIDNLFGVETELRQKASGYP